MSRKMAALELIGPLVAISTAAQQVSGRPIRFWVDNKGSCGIWKHGFSSSCLLSNCIVKTIAAVAAALGCQVDICKITRCNGAGAVMADALSKADWNRFKIAGGHKLDLQPGKIPRALLKWCQQPVVDEQLGSRIIAELAQEIQIVGINC